MAEKVAVIDKYYIENFANFLQKMQDSEDVDGNSLLHNSMLVYGGAIADGRFYQAEKQPMSNLFVRMLDLMGAPVNNFGDSNGKLSLA